MANNNNNKLSRQQIDGIGEAYRQITEKVSISTSSTATVDMGLGGKGKPGLGLDGKSNWYGKPNTVTGKPTVKGNKKAGYGFELQAAAFAKIAKTIKDAGISFDENDPIEISRALNNLKGKKQEEVIDKIAKDFGLKGDRKEILSDVQRVFKLMADYQREWAREAESHEKKLNDARIATVSKLWNDPENRVNAAVNAVHNWRKDYMGSDAGKHPGDPQGQQAPPGTNPREFDEPIGRESEPGDVDPEGNVKRTWWGKRPSLTRTFPWEPKRPTPTLGDPMRGHITPDKGIMGMPGTPWGPGGENQPPAQGQQRDDSDPYGHQSPAGRKLRKNWRLNKKGHRNDPPLQPRVPRTGPPQGRPWPTYTYNPDDATRYYGSKRPGQKVDPVGLPTKDGDDTLGSDYYDRDDPTPVGLPYGDIGNDYYQTPVGGQQGDGNPQGQQGQQTPYPGLVRKAPIFPEVNPDDHVPWRKKGMTTWRRPRGTEGGNKREYINVDQDTNWGQPGLGNPVTNVGMPDSGLGNEYYDQQGQQAPTGRDASRDARIKNVQDTIQTRKLEKQGVYTPQSKNKVGKKLIKDAMTRHPEKGEPTFVISKGSKDYDEIIKKYGTELENNNGEYETAEAGIKEWYPYGFRTTEGYRGYLLRRYARKPGFKITPKGTLTTVGKGVAGGLGIVIIVGGVAIYYSHTVASDETAPENIPGFGDINPGEHVPYDPTPGVIPVGYGDSPSIGFMGMPGTGWGPGESPY